MPHLSPNTITSFTSFTTPSIKYVNHGDIMHPCLRLMVRESLLVRDRRDEDIKTMAKLSGESGYEDHEII